MGYNMYMDYIDKERTVEQLRIGFEIPRAHNARVLKNLLIVRLLQDRGVTSMQDIAAQFNVEWGGDELTAHVHALFMSEFPSIDAYTRLKEQKSIPIFQLLDEYAQAEVTLQSELAIFAAPYEDPFTVGVANSSIFYDSLGIICRRSLENPRLQPDDIQAEVDGLKAHMSGWNFEQYMRELLPTWSYQEGTALTSGNSTESA